ncbi:MAG TPA: hypothetical protein VK177_00215 [Flavobacteriales bacterium]|nr:hypothetical protein [Flavobacteriales bacterium]
MNRIFTLSLLLAGLTLNAQKVTPGISAAQFKTKLPGILPEKTTYNESISRDEKMGHFNGTWYFDFKNDTMQSATYSDNLGKKPPVGSFSTYMKYYSYFQKDMGRPIRTVTPKDSILSPDRKRLENIDTVACGMWRNRHTLIVMGIYFTGNYKVKLDPGDMASQKNINGPVSMDYYVFTIRCLPLNDPKAPDAWQFYPGMHVNQFMKTIPELFPNGLGVNGQFNVSERKIGLEGNRSYTFKADKLDWTNWNHYAGKCDEVTHNNLVRSTNAIIAEYTKVYGKPTAMNNDVKFNKNEMLSPVEGNLKATWDKGTFTIDISYRQLSGKGTCDLLINVEEKLK